MKTFALYNLYNMEYKRMKLTITRIESEIITCELEDGTIIDIAQKWFPPNTHEGNIIEFDLTENQNRKK